MRNWVRLLIMFAPMIMREVNKWRSRRPRALPPSDQRPRRKVKQEAPPPEEEVIYEDEFPAEDEFVDPINN